MIFELIALAIVFIAAFVVLIYCTMTRRKDRAWRAGVDFILASGTTKPGDHINHLAKDGKIVWVINWKALYFGDMRNGEVILYKDLR